MIRYKVIYKCKNPKKETIIFYDTKQDAENDAKIILSAQYDKNNLSVEILEVNKKVWIK